MKTRPRRRITPGNGKGAAPAVALSTAGQSMISQEAIAGMALENNYELLQERLIELEMALESQGWLQLSGAGDTDLSRKALGQISRLALINWIKNPLIKQGVRVQANYVFGQGVRITARDSDVDEVIQAFLSDSRNQAELTSHQSYTTKEQELTVYGNLFFVFFTNKINGRVQIRSIPFDEIQSVVSNPEDSKEPWYYLRHWSQMEEGGQAKSKAAYYPDWHHRPDDKPASYGNIPINWDIPVYHVAVNRLGGMQFGVSEVYAAIDWARAYKNFLEDWATLTRAYSRFAHKVSTPGGKRGIASARAKLATTFGGTSPETNPSPVAGATFISSGGTDITPMRIGGANIASSDGRRLLLMVAAAMGLPETFFGDVSVGNLATAKSLDRPTELQMRNRQMLWTSILTGICDFVIEKSVATPAGVLKGQVIADEDGSPIVILAGGASAAVDVQFPPILEHDVGTRVDAIVAAATLKGSASAGTIPNARVLARILLDALGLPDVDKLLEELFPEGDNGSVFESLMNEANAARKQAGLDQLEKETEVALQRIFRNAERDSLKESA